MLSKKAYIAMRGKYTPKKIRVIFVLESPPESGKYFYNLNGKISEPLFRAMMGLIGCKSSDKSLGLAGFVKSGFIIVDATYVPVNHSRNIRERNQVILESYPDLVKDLRAVTKNKKTPIILVKANICELLANPLKADGFNVINDGVRIPFPASGQQTRFRERVAVVFKKAALTKK